MRSPGLIFSKITRRGALGDIGNYSARAALGDETHLALTVLC